MIPFQMARITELRNLISKEYVGKKDGNFRKPGSLKTAEKGEMWPFVSQLLCRTQVGRDSDSSESSPITWLNLYLVSLMYLSFLLDV